MALRTVFKDKFAFKMKDSKSGKYHLMALMKIYLSIEKEYFERLNFR